MTTPSHGHREPEGVQRSSATESRPDTTGFTAPSVVVVATFGAIVCIAEATFGIFAIFCGLGLFGGA